MSTKTLVHEDGKEETFKQIASRIRDKGALSKNVMALKNGCQCVLGVVEDYKVTPFPGGSRAQWPMTLDSMTYLFQRWYLVHPEKGGIASTNDRFKGTNVARAEFMAKLIEVL